VKAWAFIFARIDLMKLYLSSVGIPDTKAYLKLFKSGPKHVVIIPTAWNTTPESKSTPYVERTKDQFDDLMFSYTMLNLEDYAGNGEGLRKKLEHAEGVWILGGNSFYLNYWIHKSGFDVILPGLLKKGLVYGGESAGAVIAGRTLHGIEFLDNPDDAPQIIWTGLNLVDYGIIPHWGHEKYADRMQQTYNEMQLFGPVKTLANDAFIN
jgi:dipeptidase E